MINVANSTAITYTIEQILNKDAVGNLIQLISAIAVAITAWLLYNEIKNTKEQTKELRAAQKISNFIKIIDQIGTDNARAFRKILKNVPLLTALKTTDPNQLTPLDLTNLDLLRTSMLVKPTDSHITFDDAAKYVAVTYDRMAFILEYDVETEEKILGFHGDVIADMWLRLRPLVRLWRNEYPIYVTYFEKLGKKAILKFP